MRNEGLHRDQGLSVAQVFAESHTVADFCGATLEAEKGAGIIGHQSGGARLRHAAAQHPLGRQVVAAGAHGVGWAAVAGLRRRVGYETSKRTGDDDDRRENGPPEPVEKEADGDLVRGRAAFAAERPVAVEVEAAKGKERAPGDARGAARRRSGAGPGDPGGADRPRRPEAQGGRRRPGAATDGGEGADGGDPGRPECTASRRRRVDEPVRAMSGTGVSESRVGRPRAAIGERDPAFLTRHRGSVAVSPARRDLHQAPRRRAHRRPRRDGGRRRRRPPRGG